MLLKTYLNVILISYFVIVLMWYFYICVNYQKSISDTKNNIFLNGIAINKFQENFLKIIIFWIIITEKNKIKSNPELFPLFFCSVVFQLISV